MQRSSLSRTLASHANGGKSRGPATEEGKRRSGTNAIQHGLAPQSVLIPGESAIRLRSRQESMTHGLAPVNSLEEFLASRVTADAYWQTHLQPPYALTLLRGGAGQHDLAEQNHEDSSGFPQLANEPRLENATPESGEKDCAP